MVHCYFQYGPATLGRFVDWVAFQACFKGALFPMQHERRSGAGVFSFGWLRRGVRVRAGAPIFLSSSVNPEELQSS
jgi:hypothetical protein